MLLIIKDRAWQPTIFMKAKQLHELTYDLNENVIVSFIASSGNSANRPRGGPTQTGNAAHSGLSDSPVETYIQNTDDQSLRLF